MAPFQTASCCVLPLPVQLPGPAGGNSGALSGNGTPQLMLPLGLPPDPTGSWTYWDKVGKVMYNWNNSLNVWE